MFANVPKESAGMQYRYMVFYWSAMLKILSLICAEHGTKAVREKKGLMNRGMDRGRGLDIDEPFFSDSSSNLKHDEVFQISQKLIELNLAE